MGRLRPRVALQCPSVATAALVYPSHPGWPSTGGSVVGGGVGEGPSQDTVCMVIGCTLSLITIKQA